MSDLQIFNLGDRSLSFSWQSHQVPHIRGFREEDGNISITVYRDLLPFYRFGSFRESDLEQIIPLVATVSAVAAGYTCFGKSSRKMNPYGPSDLNMRDVVKDFSSSLAELA